MKKGLMPCVLALSLTAVAGASALFAPHTAPDYEEIAIVQTVAILKQGSQGNEVKEVQRRLKQWGYYKGAVDGIYGQGTLSAVKAFQKKNGLTADGIVGKATYAALGMNDSYNALEGNKPNQGQSQSSAPSGYTNTDLYLLAKVIHAEARGEVYTGKVAVGAVVLNRVESSSFPNTISGVIYQSGAFTAVSDGQINLEPDQSSMNAARDAMNGWDPTYGCLYYYNPAKATSSWIFSRKTVTTIGKHVFAI